MAGKNITYQAWVKKEQETHRNNIKGMTSHLIESGAMKPPARVAVLEANPRKQKLEAERIAFIEAENARLLHRMTKIMDQGPSFTVLHRSKVFISNAVSRKLAATKIANRNIEFCERINKVKPYYDTKKWDEERKVTEHILKGMGLYPYHPPQPKRWQDYFEPEGEVDVGEMGVEEELDRQWVQSLASFSNRPSQINEELNRSDSFSPKSLRRPKGDNWMLPGLARPGQYSRDSSGRISQTLSDGRMEQLSPDSPSVGAAVSVAARSGLRLQPLAKTPMLEAVPRRTDAPILNSRPNSRDAVAFGAGERGDLWSSDGKQGSQMKTTAGQQQLAMSLRNDDAEEESDTRHHAHDGRNSQDKTQAYAAEQGLLSHSQTAYLLHNDSTAATAGSTVDPDASPENETAFDLQNEAVTAVESVSHEDAVSAAVVDAPLSQVATEEAPDAGSATAFANVAALHAERDMHGGEADTVEENASEPAAVLDSAGGGLGEDEQGAGCAADADDNAAADAVASVRDDTAALTVSTAADAETGSSDALDNSVQEEMPVLHPGHVSNEAAAASDSPDRALVDSDANALHESESSDANDGRNNHAAASQLSEE
jgi:hypothetical protein